QSSALPLQVPGASSRAAHAGPVEGPGCPTSAQGAPSRAAPGRPPQTVAGPPRSVAAPQVLRVSPSAPRGDPCVHGHPVPFLLSSTACVPLTSLGASLPGRLACPVSPAPLDPPRSPPPVTSPSPRHL